MKRDYGIIFIIIILMISCSRIFKKKETRPPEEAPEAVEIVAENYVSDAIDYYQADKYKEAIQRWKKALKLIPDDAEVHNFVGLAYHRSGELDSAITYFNIAVKKNPDYHQAWNNLGYMYFLKSEYRNALTYFDSALKINPNYEQARLNRSKTAEILEGKLSLQAFEIVEKTAKIDSLELQIMNYRKALEIDSNYVEAWNNLGVAYFYYSNLDSAVICLKKALDKNPDYPPAHNNVAYILDVLGEYDKAIAHYQKAIILKPNYIIAMANLVDSYVHKEDFFSAKEILDTLYQTNSQNYLVRERYEEYQELLYGKTPEGGK
jgi:protein O-GlcNAc transferase